MPIRLILLSSTMCIFTISLPAFSLDPVHDDSQRDQKIVMPDSDLMQKNTIQKPKLDALELTPDNVTEYPEAFESLLLKLVINGDVDRLRDVLPSYTEISNYDPSLIDWGNAIIAASEGDFKTAINLYRKIISAIPNLSPVRFQLAVLLYQDKQYIAAKNEFEKLRSSELPDKYLAVIDAYLDKISKMNEWDISFGTSYIHDNNVNNAPPEGTKIVYPNGVVVSSNQKRESATGLDFNFALDKRFNVRDNLFAALHLSSSGKYYWDNKKYNDLSARVGAGFGYANATTEVELIPFYSQRFYVNRNENNSNFDRYNQSYGLRLEGSQWLSTNLRYQGAFEWGHNDHRDEYHHLDGNDFLLSNTILYMRNPKQYFFGGLDFSLRDVISKTQSYHRIGTRVGWGQEWGKGISTRATLGVGKKQFDDQDFFAIKQKSTDYSVGLSIWQRDLHFWDVTPRLTWRYNKVKSNHPFYNYDDNNFFIEFTKSF